jgi:hypothetical protein
MRKEWGYSALNDEQIDKCKHLEKKAEIVEGFIKNSKLIDNA